MNASFDERDDRKSIKINPDFVPDIRDKKYLKDLKRDNIIFKDKIYLELRIPELKGNPHLIKKEPIVTAQFLRDLRARDLAGYVRAVSAILTEDTFGKNNIRLYWTDRSIEAAQSATLSRYDISLVDFRRDKLELIKQSSPEAYFEEVHNIGKFAVQDAKSSILIKLQFRDISAREEEGIWRTALASHGVDLDQFRKEYSAYLKEKSPEKWVSHMFAEVISYMNREITDRQFDLKIYYKNPDIWPPSAEENTRQQMEKFMKPFKVVLARYGEEISEFLSVFAQVVSEKNRI